MKPKRQIWVRPRRDRGGRFEVDAWLPAGSVPPRIRRVFATEGEALKFAATLEPRLSVLDPAPVRDQAMTLETAFERYFGAKARKRSIAGDRRIAEHLKAEFGATTRVRNLTAGKIAAYRERRLAARSLRRKDAAGNPTRLSAASINRPLALLRHLLRLAHDEWEAIPVVPKIRLEREPQGRIRWLEPDEEARLLAACRAAALPYLADLVTVALETGMRRAEVEGLTWDRVDLSRGVLRLEATKSGKRREIPMRQAVYDVLARRPYPRDLRVWPRGSTRGAFETAVESARLDSPFRFHDTRHSFASWFMMRGGSLAALQKILGHATLAMTSRYAHLSPGYLRGEMDRTERLAEAVQEPVAGTSEAQARVGAVEVAGIGGAGGGS